jgi:hypothetical protein
MVNGELYRFLEKSYNGDMYYYTVFPDVRIGGLMPSRQTIPLSMVHPLKEKLEYALLEIGVVVPSEKVNWRIKVNGISVTKEFKPHAVSPSGNGLFAKLVYDITSILKTPESLRKRRVNVTFKTEGMTDILIRQVSLLALYPTDEAKTHISYLSGSVSLKPGEKKVFETRYSGGNGILKAILFVPSKRAMSKIVINGEQVHEIYNIQGIDEINFKLDKLAEKNTIEIEHIDIGEKYYPRELNISTLLLYKQIYKEPKLEITEYNVPEVIPVAGGSISVKIENKGESRPDKTLLVVMLHGNVIARRKLDNPLPGEKLETSIDVKLPEGTHDLVVRIIWNKLSKMYYMDKRIRVTVK